MGRCEKELFRVVDRELAGPREKYAMYMNEPNLLYEALEKGAEKARAIAKVNLTEIKKRIGFERSAERSLFYNLFVISMSKAKSSHILLKLLSCIC